jgi:hypothetical protein
MSQMPTEGYFVYDGWSHMLEECLCLSILYAVPLDYVACVAVLTRGWCTDTRMCGLRPGLLANGLPCDAWSNQVLDQF